MKKSIDISRLFFSMKQIFYLNDAKNQLTLTLALHWHLCLCWSLESNKQDKNNFFKTRSLAHLSDPRQHFLVFDRYHVKNG